MKGPHLMTRCSLVIAAVVLAALASSGAAHAAVVASYSFAGGSGASSDSDAGSVAGTFTVQGGTGSGSSGISVPNENVYYSATTTAANNNTTDAAIANNAYAGFTVDFGASPYNLTSLSFDYRINNDHSTTSFGIRVMNSVTGFTSYATTMDSDDAVSAGVNRTYEFPVGTTANDTDSPTVNVNTDLTDPYASNIIGNDLQGVTGVVEFRFYFVDSSTGSTRYHRIDNVVLEGTQVPAPAALPGALVMIGLLASRRR